ncbi:MAG: hypothetical protein KDE34_24465 [Anaerolineales bacterium]|nr:hypothetical protein [Anaerolineales bacterium]
MLNNDYAQLARDRRQAHEDYIAEETLVRSLLTPRAVSLGGLALFLVAALIILFTGGCMPGQVAVTEAVSTLAPISAPATATIEQSPEEATVPAAITADQLTGRFRVYDRFYPSAIEFGADGRFCRAASINKLATAPVDEGWWFIEGDLLVLTSDESVNNCGDGPTGRYRLSRYQNGGILFERQSEECAARIGYLPTVDSQPIQPTGILCASDASELCAAP